MDNKKGNTVVGSGPEDFRETTDVTMNRMFLFDYHLNPRGKYGRFYFKLGYAQGQVVDTRSIVENKQFLGMFHRLFTVEALSINISVTLIRM